jgi:lipopolysaccharide/colanic/teichoic acid biosynthesis glycosyltransferase
VSSEVETARRIASPDSRRTARGLVLWDPAWQQARASHGFALSQRTETEASAFPDSKTHTALNVAVAAALLILAAPLMAAVALFIRLTSPGPVLFAQERVGLDRRAGSRTGGQRRRSDLGGRPVRIYKFRTMVFDRGQADQVWTRPNDERITGVGRLLRGYRIDELPQLFNVLKREMNVVGPRPEQPQIFSHLREQYERFPDRQKVLPGITGLAQVDCGYGGDDFHVRRKLERDLEYVEQRSLRQDLRILLQTIPVVLTRRGAR